MVFMSLASEAVFRKLGEKSHIIDKIRPVYGRTRIEHP